MVVGTLGVLLAGAIAASLIFRPGDGYPTTPEGWAARWDAAMRAAGRTPGEGWDAWAALADELRPVIDGTGVIDPDSERVQRVFDDLVAAAEITAEAPRSAGAPEVLDFAVAASREPRGLALRVIKPELDRTLLAKDRDNFTRWMRRGWAISRATVSIPSILSAMGQFAVNLLLFDQMESWLFDHGGWEDDDAVALIMESPMIDIESAILIETELGLGWMTDSVRSSSILQARDQMRLYEEFMQTWADSLASAERSEQSKLDELSRRYGSSGLYLRRRAAMSQLIPATSRVTTFTNVNQVRRDGLLLKALIERFHRDTGAYPERLEDLIPDQLAAIPSDPFAPDGQFRYRVLTGEASAAGPYLLYSVGVDGIDDGGRENPADAARGLGRPDVGGDHVFGPRRPKTAEDPDAEPVPDPAPQQEP